MADNSRDVELVIKARDEATKVIKTINQALKSTITTQKALRTAGAGSGSVFKSLTAGIKSLKSAVGPDGVFGKLAAQTGVFKDNIKRLTANIADYKAQQRELNADQKNITQSVNESADAVAKLTTKQEIQNQLARESGLALKALGTEAGVLGREQKALANTTDRLNTSLAASQNAITAANKAIKAGDSDIERRKVKLDGLIAKENALKLALSSARSKQQGRIDRGDTSSQAFLNGQSRIEKLSGQIGKNQSDQQKEIDAITKANAARTAHIKTIGKEEAAIVQNGIKQNENAQAIARNANAQVVNNQKTAEAAKLNKALNGALDGTKTDLIAAEGVLSGYNKTLGETQVELRKLARDIDSSETQLKGFKAELGAVEAEEKAAQKSLKALGAEFKTSLEPAMKDAKRVARGLDDELETLQREFNELNSVLDKNGIHTSAQTRRLAELKAEMRSVDAARRGAYAGHRNLSTLRKEPVGDLADLGDRTGRAQVAVNQTTDAERELVRIRRQAIKVAKELEAAEEKLARDKLRAAEASKRAAAAERRHAEAMRRTLFAGNANIGVMRRLRTTVLAVGSAYLGFHAVFRGFEKAIDSTKKLEAATNRLRVVVGDDQHVIGEELDFVRRNAERLGIEFGMLAQEYTKFSIATKNTILEGANSRKIFLAVSEAARVNNASTEDLRGTYLALIQIISKGRITMEELKRQLGDRLPGAVHIMADALGVGTDELLKIVEAGDLSSDKLIEFADELEKRFGPGLEKALLSTQALIGKFENAVFQASLRVGQGGFIEAFNNLLKQMQETLASGEFVSFLDRVSKILAAIMNVVSAGVKNWRGLLQVIAALVAIKLTLVLGGIGIALVGLAAKVRILAVAVGGLGRAISLLGGIGIVLGLVAAAAAYFTKVKTAGTEANEVFARHKELMDQVRNNFDKVNGEAKEFLKTLEDITLLQAEANKIGIQKQYDKATADFLAVPEIGKRAGFGSFADNESLNTINNAGKKLLKQIEDASPTDSLKKFYEEYSQKVSAILADSTLSDAIQDDVKTGLVGALKIIQEQAPKLKQAIALFGAKSGENLEGLLSLVDPQKEFDLQIAELGSDVEGFEAKLAAMGREGSKEFDKLTKQAESLTSVGEEAAKAFKQLEDTLRAAGKEDEANMMAERGSKFFAEWAKQVENVRVQWSSLVFEMASVGVVGKAVALLTQNDSFLDFDQAGQRVQLLRKELRGLITDFDDLPDTMQATLIDLQHRGELRGRTIDAINNQASIESIANTIKPSEYGAGNDSADRILAAGAAYNNMLSRRIDLLDKEGLLTDDLIDSLEFKLVLLKLNEAGLKKEEFILAGITAARKADRNLEGTAKDARIQELLGQIYRDNESSKKNKQLKAAEDKRKELDALVALREAEQQLFDLERDRAVGEGRNTKTDPTLNALRDKDKTTGEEIDKLIKQVIGLYSELEQTPEVRQALAELAIQFDEIEVAAGRAREVILGWNDLGELATGSLRGGMDIFIKKIFEGVKGIRALESAFLNLISTFSAKIADVFLDLAAKSAVQGIGKLFGLLIGGIGGGASTDIFKDFFSSNKPYHKGGQVKHGGSKGYDFDVNNLHLPRFHNGKLVGLASDEVPAILQTGELVVPRDKVAEAMKGGGGGGGSPVFAPNIINTFSPEETAEAVINADNTDGLLINKMSKNPRAFKNALGIK